MFKSLVKRNEISDLSFPPGRWLGLVFILLTISKYGAGVSSDAARNLSTADSLLAGKGFVDMLGGPFILWPPLYPLLLAGLSLLTKWNTFQAAWYLNVALYPVNIWLSGWLLYVIFKEKLSMRSSAH